MGLPAWMPGEPRWAKDGPSRRAHGAGPERGNLSAAKALHHRVPIHSMRRGTLGFCLHSGAAMGIPVDWIIEWRTSRYQGAHAGGEPSAVQRPFNLGGIGFARDAIASKPAPTKAISQEWMQAYGQVFDGLSRLGKKVGKYSPR